MRIKMEALKLCCLSLVLIVANVCAADTPGDGGEPPSFFDMDIRTLMNIEVTSVSKKAEKLSQTDAAIFVITHEDIRRSSATTVPELFRMVPGVHVGRVNSVTWAISVRGFNGVYSNKLLVLVDGRAVYSPLFSGVYWNAQDILLDDIQRIEIIRGPGATLWGANAVNGIINIITKKAVDTQGVTISSAWSNVNDGYGGLQYGGKLGKDFYFRAYAKYQRLNITDRPYLKQPYSYTEGFRIDGSLSEDDKLTFLGGSYDGKLKASNYLPVYVETPDVIPVEKSAGYSERYLMARWERYLSATSEMKLQVYYDRTKIPQKKHGETIDVNGKFQYETVDMDFQHRFRLKGRHDILWGLGMRMIRDEITHNFELSTTPDDRVIYLYNAFLQDEIELMKNVLKLRLGAKLEHNYYTGFEIQPSGRLLWTPNPIHTFWAAMSRAVRTPSRFERDASIVLDVPAPGVVVELRGSKDRKSEDLLAYESGYRIQPSNSLSIDIAAFYNIYKKLGTLEDGAMEYNSYVIFPVLTGDKMDGKTYGLEVSANWQALNWWRLQASFSHLRMQLKLRGNSTDTTSRQGIEGRNPKKQFTLRSLMNVGRDVELDTEVYYVGVLPYLGINGYTDLNVRVGWKPYKNIELSLIGQNLLDDTHPEFVEDFVLSTNLQVRRTVNGKITWKF